MDRQRRLDIVTILMLCISLVFAELTLMEMNAKFLIHPGFMVAFFSVVGLFQIFRLCDGEKR